MKNNLENLTLNHFLAQNGVASRRHAAEMILEGHVSVNGEVMVRPGYRMMAGDTVTINGKCVGRADESSAKDFVYVLLNKPAGYECSRPSQFTDKTVYDLINIPGRRLFTVGRLDKNSEGMILLTDDGLFAQKITHPSFEIPKTYVLKTQKPLLLPDIERLENGIEDEGEMLRLKSIIPRKAPYVWEIVLTEGKKREIRRMVRAVENRTVRLTRIGIGKLFMLNLPKGQWTYLDREGIELIHPGLLETPKKV